jgi:hypothetical protein
MKVCGKNINPEAYDEKPDASTFEEEFRRNRELPSWGLGCHAA